MGWNVKGFMLFLSLCIFIENTKVELSVSAHTVNNNGI